MDNKEKWYDSDGTNYSTMRFFINIENTLKIIATIICIIYAIVVIFTRDAFSGLGYSVMVIVYTTLVYLCVWFILGIASDFCKLKIDTENNTRKTMRIQSETLKQLTVLTKKDDTENNTKELLYIQTEILNQLKVISDNFEEINSNED